MLSGSAPTFRGRMPLVFLANFIIFVSLHSLTRSCEAQSDLVSQIQEKLDAWHRDANFPGATLGVVLPDSKVLSFAVGFSNRELKTPMQPDDLMLAGSVGKMFAAATMLQLVQEGKAQLDQPIAPYFANDPWFARLPNATTITLRQLMNHTSGLVRYEFKDQFTQDLTQNPNKVWKPEELLAYLLDEKAPFEPGQGWDYSDTNYIVLGMIIERITQDSFYAQAQSRLIAPLRLTRTVPQDSPVIAGLIQGYAGENNPFGGQDAMLREGRMIINPQFEWTGGGFASNATDLARWGSYVFSGQAFAPPMLEQALQGVPAPMLGRTAQYGLGVIIRSSPPPTTYGHSGFFPGYLTELAYYPASQVSLAIQVNCSTPRQLGKPLTVLLHEIHALTTAP